MKITTLLLPLSLLFTSCASDEPNENDQEQAPIEKKADDDSSFFDNFDLPDLENEKKEEDDFDPFGTRNSQTNNDKNSTEIVVEENNTTTPPTETINENNSSNQTEITTNDTNQSTTTNETLTLNRDPLTTTEIDSIKRTTRNLKIALAQVNDKNQIAIADIIHTYLNSDLDDTTTGGSYSKNSAFNHYSNAFGNVNLTSDEFNAGYFIDFITYDYALDNNNLFETITVFPDRSILIKTLIMSELKTHIFQYLNTTGNYLAAAKQFPVKAFLFNESGSFNRALASNIDKDAAIATLLLSNPLYSTMISDVTDNTLYASLVQSTKGTQETSKALADFLNTNTELLNTTNSSNFSKNLFDFGTTKHGDANDKHFETLLTSLFSYTNSATTFTEALIKLAPAERAAFLDVLYLGKSSDSNNSTQASFNIAAMTQGLQNGLNSEGLSSYQNALKEFPKVVALPTYSTNSKLMFNIGLAYLSDTNQSSTDFTTLLETMFTGDIGVE